jgi:hypothetical protein
MSNSDDKGQDPRYTGRLITAARRLKRHLKPGDQERCVELSHRMYHAVHSNPGYQGSAYELTTEEGLEALRELHELSGAAQRMASLEDLVALQKSALSKKDKQLRIQWEAHYNTQKFTKIGVLQVDNEGKIVFSNNCFDEYFGKTEGLDVSGLIRTDTRDRQEIALGEKEYIAQVIANGPIGTDVKIYEKGWWSRLRAEREEQEENHRRLMENSERILAEIKAEREANGPPKVNNSWLKFQRRMDHGEPMIDPAEPEELIEVEEDPKDQ